MPEPEFEARELVVTHQTIWDGIEEFAKQRNATLRRIDNGDEDHLPGYIFVPNNLPKGTP